MSAGGESAPLVLVVDDHERFRLLVRAILVRHGMRVIEAKTGEEALGAVADTPPDVVVLDWLMPGGGLALAHSLIADHGLRDRVIMLTALDDPRDRKAALEAGVSRYFVKPPDPEQLIAAVQDALAAPEI
jgi:two-component system, OmpR family, phosphate regulon response regulator PhoB